MVKFLSKIFHNPLLLAFYSTNQNLLASDTNWDRPNIQNIYICYPIDNLRLIPRKWRALNYDRVTKKVKSRQWAINNSDDLIYRLKEQWFDGPFVDLHLQFFTFSPFHRCPFLKYPRITIGLEQKCTTIKWW